MGLLYGENCMIL